MPAEDLRLVEKVINARVQHFSEYGRDVPSSRRNFYSFVWYR